jgi:tricorn protease
MSQMVGELCVSHTYVGGGDFGPTRLAPSPVYPGYLGADFSAENGYYRFAKVYGPTAYARDLKAPLADPAPKVREGEYLLAIDGQPLRAPEAIQARLQVIKGQKVVLTVNGKPTMEGARNLEVEPIPGDWNLRYERWIAGNIAAVDKASNGQLGYLHLTAMGDQNIGQFDKYWRAFRYKKGLVIDVRGNGGGSVSPLVIDRLRRQIAMVGVARNTSATPDPFESVMGPMICLLDEFSASDGDIFPYRFRKYNLGKLVGKRSWGGVVGIRNTLPLLDGGSLFKPEFATYGASGEGWIVEGHGVDPDIVVDNDPAKEFAGIDEQLNKALEIILDELKTKEQQLPPIPAFPDKSK